MKKVFRLHNRRRRSSYHIVMIPDDSSEVHRIRVRPWQLKGVFALLIALTLGLIASTGGYLHYHKEYRQTLSMRAEHAGLHEEQSQMVRQLSQLSHSVQRAENLVGKIGAVVLPETDERHDGVGPVEPMTVIGGIDKELTALGELSFDEFEMQAEAISQELWERSRTVEQRTAELYGDYQDRRVRLMSMPDLWPVRGWLTSRFGYRRSPWGRRTKLHEGIDVAAPWGMPIQTPADGVVSFAGYKGGLGKTLIIDHGFGLVTYYGHTSRLFVAEGEKVERGMVVAAVGNTGHSTGPHLHYEVHVDGLPVDPLTFLPSLSPTSPDETWSDLAAASKAALSDKEED